MRILLEPLSSRVDHAGTFLSGTVHGLDLVQAADHPSVGLLYDLCHSVTMGENHEDVLDGRGSLVGHVHLADAPGRREPAAAGSTGRKPSPA